MKTLKYSILAAAIALPASTMADTWGDQNEYQGLYIGAQVGFTKLKDADEYDDDNNAMQVILGGRFNQYFAIEGTIIDFGDFGSDAYEVGVDGYTLQAKGILPLTDAFEIYGKAGGIYYDDDALDGSDLLVGIGAAYSLGKNWDINLEFNRYTVGFDLEDYDDVEDLGNVEGDLDQTSLGVTYTF